MKKQIIVVHGGDTFDTYQDCLTFLKEWQLDFERYRSHKKDWKVTLNEELGEDFLSKGKTQTELRKIKKDISALKKSLDELQSRKAVIEKTMKPEQRIRDNIKKR